MKKLTLLTILLFSLAVPGFAAHPGGTVYADVNGLVCDFCARALEKVFGKQKAVQSIKVDLDKKIVAVHFNKGESLDDATITQMITDSGYHVRGLRRTQ